MTHFSSLYNGKHLKENNWLLKYFLKEFLTVLRWTAFSDKGGNVIVYGRAQSRRDDSLICRKGCSETFCRAHLYSSHLFPVIAGVEKNANSISSGVMVSLIATDMQGYGGNVSLEENSTCLQ